MAEKNLTESLMGEKCNAVCFVMDYVELHFDGPILRSLTNPRVLHKNVAVFPKQGSHEALCSLIGKEVTLVEENQECISLEFKDGTRFEIPLNEAVGIGGEAAHFVAGPNISVQIWLTNA